MTNNNSNSKIKILHLEDLASDAEMIERELKKGKINFEKIVVDNKKDFEKALHDFKPDIIISDHSLPSFDSIQALEILRELRSDIPFILVTATVSEEFAVDIMKKGAADYMLKDRIQRLPAAVLNALEKWRLEKERKQYLEKIITNEGLLKETEHLAQIGSWQTNLVEGSAKWSNETYHILGYKPGEIQPSLKNFLISVHPADRDYVRKAIEEPASDVDLQKISFRVIDKSGNIKFIRSELMIERNKQKESIRITGFNQDVTEIMLAEIERTKVVNELTQRNKDLEQFKYIVSHNLRSPVANILGAVSVMNDTGLTPKEKNILSEGLSASVTKLDNVVKDLNHILQVKSEINETKEKVCFSELVDDIKISIKNLIDSDEIEIKYDFSEMDEMVTLKGYLYSIFFNLISNSIKYRQEQIPCIINIKSHREKDKMELIFTDNGRGIDMKKKGEQVFGLYKRFHTSIEGKGMGLFMVKTQVETLGGKISIKSEVNIGTEFKIEFEK